MRSSSAKTPALLIEQLNKTYPNGTRALCDLDLEVSGEELVVILGPSGAGKSTLLRCVNRLVTPTSGHIHFKGEDVTRFSGRELRKVRLRIGMIFQQFNLVRRLTVLENVLAGRLAHRRGISARGLSLLKMFPESERDQAFECLRKVHIENLAFQRADTLSGGQQQRVAIARTLAQEPDMILADEPVASLDPASAETVMRILEQIHIEHEIPVIVNLHQIDLGKRYGKRIIGMNSGRICFDGPPEDLTESKLLSVYGHELDHGMGVSAKQRTPSETIPGNELEVALAD